MTTHNCPRCGGTLVPDAANPNRYECPHCHKVVDASAAERQTESFAALFDAAKQTLVHNLRRKLYDAVTATYISRAEVLAACDELRTYLPDDFLAGFFRVAAGKNLRALNRAINEIDAEEHYDDMGLVISFLVKSMSADNDYLLALNNLVERAYKTRDLTLFSQYATEVSAQAEQVVSGVYETTIPREVFVMYSSRDMEQVSALVEAIEEQGLSCFVAARNLRHGVGSVEDYNSALETAMDYCRVIVFVSSLRSRNFGCDALRVELPYIQSKDIQNAPAEFRNNYERIPHKYKKPRIEYRIEESPSFNMADKNVNQFFSGYERVYTVEGVLERLGDLLYGAEIFVEDTPEPPVSPAPPVPPVPPTPPTPPIQSVPAPTEDASTFRVRVLSCGNQKLICIKILREFFGIGLAESKSMVDLLPSTIPYDLPRERADDLCRQLTSAGITVELSASDSTPVAPPRAETPVPPAPAPVWEDKPTVAAPVPPPRPRFSEGLEFDRFNEGYKLVGMGDCTDTDLVIPETYEGLPVVDIDSGLFFGNEELTSVVIPPSVMCIGFETFGDCVNLRRVDIPVGVTDIEEAAFHNCTNLTTISLPDGLETLGETVFQDCTALTSMHIPASVNFIGECVFRRCDALSSLTVDPNNPLYSGEGNCIVFRVTNTLIAGCRNSVIPAGVTAIGADAFAGHSGLTSVTIPAGVTRIGDSAFDGCTALTAVQILGRPTSIPYGAFNGCRRLTELRLPVSVTALGAYAISECESLRTITYEGTMAQWAAVRKDPLWDDDTPDFTVRCTDGDVSKEGLESPRATAPQRPMAQPQPPRQVPTPKPVPKPQPRTPDPRYAVGSVITFGTYEQEAEVIEPKKLFKKAVYAFHSKPIEWIVLANEGNRALLISKYILDCQQYHTSGVAVTWESCSLRKWLNRTFLNTAFNATERGRILASRIKNPNNARGTNGGNDTTDLIFCLSIAEAYHYITAMAAVATPAIQAKGTLTVHKNGNSWWWLRSPGYNSSFAANIDNSGGVYSDGNFVNVENSGVRPALWLNIES